MDTTMIAEVAGGAMAAWFLGVFVVGFAAAVVAMATERPPVDRARWTRGDDEAAER